MIPDSFPYCFLLALPVEKDSIEPFALPKHCLWHQVAFYTAIEQKIILAERVHCLNLLRNPSIRDKLMGIHTPWHLELTDDQRNNKVPLSPFQPMIGHLWKLTPDWQTVLVISRGEHNILLLQACVDRPTPAFRIAAHRNIPKNLLLGQDFYRCI